MKKKIVSILLAVALIASMIPLGCITAFADAVYFKVCSVCDAISTTEIWTKSGTATGEHIDLDHNGKCDVCGGVIFVSYTVSFYMQGHGTAPDSQTVKEGGKVTKPSDPYDADCFFYGWYKEADCINAWNFDADTVTADTVIYAKWIEKASIEAEIAAKSNAAIFAVGSLDCIHEERKTYFMSQLMNLSLSITNQLQNPNITKADLENIFKNINEMNKIVASAQEEDRYILIVFIDDAKNQIDSYAKEKEHVIKAMDWLTETDMEFFLSELSYRAEGAKADIDNARSHNDISLKVNLHKSFIDECVENAEKGIVPVQAKWATCTEAGWRFHYRKGSTLYEDAECTIEIPDLTKWSEYTPAKGHTKPNEHGRCDNCGELLIFQIGDGNLDGDIDAKDLTVLISAILEGEDYNEILDCNGDGVINILDLVRLKNHLAKGTPLGKEATETEQPSPEVASLPDKSVKY